MIRNKAQVQAYLLEKLKNLSADVVDAALASSDGFIIVSTSQDTLLRDKIAALAALILRPAQKAAGELAFEGLNFVVVSGMEQSLYLKEVARGQLLAVLIKAGADWEGVQRHILRAAEDLRQVADMKETIKDRLSSQS